MKKKLMFLSAALLAVVCVEQSNGQVVLSNATITPRSASAPGDSLQVDIAFSISNLNQLNHLFLRYGTTQGGADLVNYDLYLAEQNGQQYLRLPNASLAFPVVNNQAQLTVMIAKTEWAKPNFLTVQGHDKAGKEVKKLEKAK